MDDGNFKRKADIYIEKESCSRCGEQYLTLKNRPSIYCGKTCFLKDRRHTDEAKKNMSKAHSGDKCSWYKHGAWLRNLSSYETYAHKLWCDDVDYEIVE